MKSKKTQTKASLENANLQSPASKMTTMSKLLNIIIQLMLMSIAGYIIYRTVTNAGIILYTWHPVFMAIGYLVLTSHAILAMADRNVFTQGFNYEKRVKTHWVLQAIALVLITIAQAAIYINKERNGYPHYSSTHSLFGAATYTLTLVATFGGVLTKYSFKLRGFVKPAMLKGGHAMGGITVFTLATATIFLGINQSWVAFNDIYLKFGILFCFIITTLYVVGKSFKHATSQFVQKQKK